MIKTNGFQGKNVSKVTFGEGQNYDWGSGWFGDKVQRACSGCAMHDWPWHLSKESTPTWEKAKKSSKTWAPKMLTMKRTTDIKLIAEQTLMEHAEQTARIVQMEDDIHELNGRLDYLESLNNVADLQYSLLLG